MRGLSAAILLLLLGAAPRAGAAEVLVPTDLKVSGPAVSLCAPLGFRYRPGFAFPLQVRVSNPGPAFRGELFFTEGAGGCRYGLSEGVDFPERTARVFTVPVRAPAVTPDLTLVIRELADGAGPLRFQASLARLLKPLAPDARIILTCGAHLPASFGPQEEVVQLSARELPGEDWWYDNLDLVVLGDGSFKDAPPAAQEALRRWLLGGGRLLIAHHDALAPAAAARCLPLDAAAGGGLIGADRQWWEEHAGLRASDILAQKNNRPIYIRLTLGFGAVVLLFPATSAEEAREFGAAVVNHPVLQRRGDAFPDLRVQPDRYAAFAPGAASPALRAAVARWALLGALAFCAALALAYSSRSRLVAAGWPLAVAALLAVLLAKWFPERALALSRLQMVRHSADGRAVATQEWACLEAFKEPAAVAVNGQITPLYADTAELKSAQVELACGGNQPRLQTVVYPERLALFASAARTHAPQAPRNLVLRQRGGDQTLTVACDGGAPVAPRRVAVWADKDGSLRLLRNIDAGSAVEVTKFDGWPAALRGVSGGELLRARAVALGWASREALRGQCDTLIVWDELPGEHGGIIEFEPPAPNAGALFRILVLQAAETPK